MRPTYTNDELIRAYTRAPKPIQQALDGGMVVDFVMDATDEFSLHIDTTGTLTELIRDVLIGLLPPVTFAEEMKRLIPDAETANKIIETLNAKIFKPLQDAVREEGTTNSPQQTPALQAPQPQKLPAAPAHTLSSVVTVGPTPVEQPHEPVTPIAPPAYIQKAVETPISRTVTPSVLLPGQGPVMSRPLTSVPSLTEMAPAAQTPMTPKEEEGAHLHATRTMGGDMRALKDGIDPYRVAHPMPETLQSKPSAPIAGTPIMPPTAQPAYAPAPKQPLPKEPTATETAVRSSLQQYGIDPYREPVE